MSFILFSLLVLFSLVLPPVYSQNPTPIVIEISPTPVGTATLTPTINPFGPDRFEPNDDPQTAVPIGFQTELDLTLTSGDVDTFTGYLKQGQTGQWQTVVYEGLDTRLTLFWAGQVVAENDDRSATDTSSLLTFTAPTDGWYLLQVAQAAVYDGRYDLHSSLVMPTATPTLPPTATAAPTLTPTPSTTPLIQPDLAEPNDTPETAWPLTPGLVGAYTLSSEDNDFFTFIAKPGQRYACETVTNQVDTVLTVQTAAAVLGRSDDRDPSRVDSYFTWEQDVETAVWVKVEARGYSFGPYDLACHLVVPPAVPPVVMAENPSVTAAPTAVVTAATTPSLTLTYLGQVPPTPAAPGTRMRLLVYYDANNDRLPSPGEGVAQVRVMAVDAQGQPLAHTFTNGQGEAVFTLTDEAVTRVVVPFVPGWSAPVRPGQTQNDLVLGLPAVRLPVFLPVVAEEAAQP